MLYFGLAGTDPGRQKATLRDSDKCPTVQVAWAGCQCIAHHHQHLPTQGIYTDSRHPRADDSNEVLEFLHFVWPRHTRAIESWHRNRGFGFGS